ncbi:MAG TPA: nitrate- and nitrite sensing domain-containing protein [Planosporangium sp.]|nr:nitrate- and nitrite sensing domain-containing protein [Planosporangium sp.]
MIGLVVLLAVVVVGDVSDYRIASATKGSVDLALSVQDLVQELQHERGLTSGLLGGDVGFRGEMEPARGLVDARRLAVGKVADRGAGGAAAVRAALRQLDGLADVRAQVDAGKAGRAATFQFFTDRIAALGGVDFGFDRSPDQTLRRGVDALTALGDAKEYTTQERAFLNGVFSAGGFAKGEFIQYAGMNAAQQAALAQYARYATTDQRALGDAVRDTGAAHEAAYFEDLALTAADGRLVQVNPQSWWSALTTVIDDTREVQQSVGADIQRRAQKLQGDAARRLGMLLGLVALCVTGAIGLVVAASRSITRPLAALAREADSLASVRLPEAVTRAQAGDDDESTVPTPVRVPARASSEIRSVATALDRVQATAYSLATEQALLRRNTTESLANLGRRNQNLLRRQLGFITRLEQEESDPSALANLFELDHLATRMRRNAESVLVLVGESTPRRWSAPLPVADIIRGALSEVEEYRRVTLKRIDDAYVGGAHVSGLAHMLAELVENGLAFSPPDVDVEIQGRQLPDGYLIAVIDQGIGMEPEDLERVNARLRGEESFLAAPTRFLGHYVVGQLARQMSVDVRVAPSPVTGVTARLMLPESVLARPAAIEPSDIDAPVPATVRIVGDSRGATGPVPRVPQPAQRALGARPTPVVEFITAGRPGEPVPAGAMAVPGDVPLTSAGSGDVESADRTRNGLLKRVPRNRTVQHGPAVPERADPSTNADLTPADMRARLTLLRAGVQRGENARARNADGDKGTHDG